MVVAANYHDGFRNRDNFHIIDRLTFCYPGMTGLSGDTKVITLMIRHNTLRGYELIKDSFYDICINRLLMAGISILLVIFSVWMYH